MKTLIGGERALDMLSGERLLRICRTAIRRHTLVILGVPAERR